MVRDRLWFLLLTGLLASPLTPVAAFAQVITPQVTGAQVTGPQVTRPTERLPVQAERATCSQHTPFHVAVPALETTARADEVANEMVRSIVAQVSMTANFQIRAAAFGNVAATLCQDGAEAVRYVLYDPRLVASVTPNSPNYWTLMLALAHEIGHHVNAHGLDDTDRPRLELEADFFAGYVLARLGAPQEEAATSAGRLAGFQAGVGGEFQGVPPQLRRQAEVARGWREGEAARANAKSGSASTPPATPARSSINIKPDTYVEGEGYHAIVSTSVPICREACTQDKRCAMYEFHRPTRTCGLFDHATPGGPSSDAEVGIKTGVGAHLQRPDSAAAKTAVAGWSLALRRNAYVSGEGYRVMRDTAPAVCQQACLSDDRCAMYEFYRPNASCGLFSHTRIAGESSQAEVGLKMPALASPATASSATSSAVQPARLAVRQNVYVEGAGYRTLRNSSLAACRTACLSDDRCAMYEIHRPTQSCGLYNHTTLAGPSPEAEVGIKVPR